MVDVLEVEDESWTAPFADVVASSIAIVRFAERSPPPVIGEVVEIVLALGAFAARSVVRLVT